MGICGVCNLEKETRPYTKDGSPICFECMMATPESENDAAVAFTSALEQAALEANIIVIGGENGPTPKPSDEIF